MHQPIITGDGHRIAGLRLGDRRSHALLQALLVFRLIPNGFLNRDLRGLLGKHPPKPAPESVHASATPQARLTASSYC